MDLTDWQIKAALTVLGFLGGSLLSLSTAYVIMAKEIAFIKGQLTYLLKFHEKLSKLYERQVVLDKDMSKIGSDLNQAHAKIRDLQQKAS